MQKEVGAALTRLSPLERLDEVALMEPPAEPQIRNLKEQYSHFLEHTDKTKSSLIGGFEEEVYRTARSAESRTFVRDIFELMMALGDGVGREMLRVVLV